MRDRLANDYRLALAGLLLAAIFMLQTAGAKAATLDDLDPARTYSVEAVEIDGNKTLSTSVLENEIQTKTRAWYLVWKKRPQFDPSVFRSDLKQLQQYYQAEGFYNVAINYDLKINNALITAVIKVNEGPPVIVKSVDIEVNGSREPPDTPTHAQLKFKTGQRFAVEAYQQGEEALRTYFLDAGYARAQSRRQARVNVPEHAAAVRYEIRTGAHAWFGHTVVTGNKDVPSWLILREVTYKPGEKFSQRELEKTRAKIAGLRLFDIVRMKELGDNAQRIVPIQIVVHERKFRSVRLGFGYNTISQVVADVQWTDLNWLGGGRRLTLSGTYSSITSSLAASVVQPEFLFPGAEGQLDVSENILTVPPFTLFSTDIMPSIHFNIADHLTATIGYRFEYGKLNSVDASIVTALGGVKNNGIVSGPFGTLVWNDANDPYNPSAGSVFTLKAMQAGKIFGGDFAFYRVTAEGKHYMDIGWKTVFASRLMLGLADTLDQPIDYPLWWRFFAGGEGSVRGFSYWGLGPRSASNDPIGGKSLMEGSLELRRPIWGALGGLVFIDFGQVSVHPYSPPINDLKFAAGTGATYNTPVGPVAIDIGFPFHTPDHDQNWQVYFSIGQYF